MKHVLTILAVDDVRASADFYRRALGWKIEVDVPVYVELVSEEGQRLGVYERQAFAANTGLVPQGVAPGALSSTELYFYTDDMDAALTRLRDAGARELSPLAPRPWGDEAAYFADPSGVVLVVARPR